MSEKEMQEQLEELYEKLDKCNAMISDIKQNEDVCCYGYDLYDKMLCEREEIERKISELELQNEM